MEFETLDLDNPILDGVEIAHGLAPVLNTISNLIKSRRAPKWSLFLVNFETLIRNRMSERDTATPVVDGALSDARIFANYLIALSEVCQKVIKPIIAFYIPNYKNIPNRYLRLILPAHTEERWEYLAQLKDRLVQEWDIKDDNVNVLLVEQDVNKKPWLPKALVQDIDSAGGHAVRYRDTLMFSHMPVDYHLMRRVPHWNLIESYTGNIKKPSEISMKMFGIPNMPFNKYTHVLFGDKYLLRAAAAPKIRKEMKERAAREHWELLTDPAVLKIIQQMRFMPTEFLTAPDV